MEELKCIQMPLLYISDMETRRMKEKQKELSWKTSSSNCNALLLVSFLSEKPTNSTLNKFWWHFVRSLEQKTIQLVTFSVCESRRKL